MLKWRVLEFRGTKRPPKNRYTSQIDQQVRSMRVPREKKMKSKKVRKFLPAIRCGRKIGLSDRETRQTDIYETADALANACGRQRQTFGL